MTEAATVTATIGVLTVSDRAYKGEYEDRGGPAIQAYLQTHFQNYKTESKIIADEQAEIETVIKQWATTCCLILTTGGTGPAPRDVTPEATMNVCQKLLPGFGELMRSVSLTKTPTAILSRQTAGICHTALVVNLPGSPKAIAECLDPILQALPHAVRLAGGAQTLHLLPAYHIKNRKCDECNIVH